MNARVNTAFFLRVQPPLESPFVKTAHKIQQEQCCVDTRAEEHEKRAVPSCTALAPFPSGALCEKIMHLVVEATSARQTVCLGLSCLA